MCITSYSISLLSKLFLIKIKSFIYRRNSWQVWDNYSKVALDTGNIRLVRSILMWSTFQLITHISTIPFTGSDPDFILVNYLLFLLKVIEHMRNPSVSIVYLNRLVLCIDNYTKIRKETTPATGWGQNWLAAMLFPWLLVTWLLASYLQICNGLFLPLLI